MRKLEAATISDLDIAAIVRILEQVPVTVGILYGSYAWSEATEPNDIDIAVEFNEGLSSVERTRVRLDLIEQLNVELETDDADVVLLSRAPNELLEEVLTDGVLIYGTIMDLKPYREPARPPTSHQDRLAAFDDVLEELDPVV